MKVKHSAVVIILALMPVICCSSRVFAVDGFATQNGGTTGGATGTTVTVTNGADFLTYVETEDTPYIIQVSGTIELADADEGRVRIQSNKTIRGIGENPTIIGSLGFKNDCSNVIIEGITITCPEDYTSEEDGISVKDRITNVFITKCTIYDCWDGCIDIARQSDWVTVSWCKFYFTTPNDNSDRVSLVGNTDSPGDEGTLHVTFHHNWFGQYCMQRIPSVRYGRAHVYNNYYNCPGDIYCVWSRIQAECLIENNYFKDVFDPYVNNRDGAPVEEWGLIAASGNILDNCTGTAHPGTDTVFTPPYAFTLDSTEEIPAIVQYGAGADGQEGDPPHWFYGQYGDFDLSGLVDANDLESFVGYWLATENIDDADYYDNGRVDFSEFSLFAENYMFIPSDTTPPAAPADLWALGQNAQAPLDWADNNTEEDFAGYNVYRSTSSGSGYAKLNASLLTVSDYTDGSAVNGTMYYYVVTAVDTNNNESGYSVEACAVPDPVSDSIIIQESATGFCISGDIQGIESEHSGYTGSGYANTYNETGRGVDYSVNIVTAGTYTFTFRYAGTSDRPADLIINSTTEVSGIAFTSTGEWYIWSTVSVPVTLTAGAKTVRLESTTSDGCANIDYLKIEGPAPEIAACP
ncbi:MAG: carbohydrate-binding protein [Sedimentisphaerales bacterium]|nr:carbohydrate-binding protein [Sedimentisphaerales bacterium]